MIVLLFSAFVLQQLERYKIEKQFVARQSIALTLNHLAQTAASDVQWMIAAGNGIAGDGFLQYPEGAARYERIAENGDAIIIRFSVETNRGGAHLFYVYYDKENGTIVRWEEDL